MTLSEDAHRFVQDRMDEKAHLIFGEAGTLIDQLSEEYASRVELQNEDCTSNELVLFDRLTEAALTAPKNDDEAIRRAIYDELNRILVHHANKE